MTAKEKIENYLDEMGDDETSIIVFENPAYNEAFLGISTDNRAIYKYSYMVESLMKEYNISYDEAVEFIDYNTLGAYLSDKQPIVMLGID